MLRSEATFEKIWFNINYKWGNLENNGAKLPMEPVAKSRPLLHDNG